MTTDAAGRGSIPRPAASGCTTRTNTITNHNQNEG